MLVGLSDGTVVFGSWVFLLFETPSTIKACVVVIYRFFLLVPTGAY